MRSLTTGVVLVSVALLAAGSAAQRGGKHASGGPALQGADSACLPQAVRDRLAPRLARARAELAAPAAADGTPEPYPFTPMGGRYHRDVFPGIFVDLDPSSPGWLDYECGDFSYDGHRGHDPAIRSFGEQLIGVPVFAALDGTVLLAQDGFPDMNVSGSPDAGNFVILDHGGGHESWYFHLANGSVTVGDGDPVVAGQQLGLAASSGNSYGPHLHFETQHSGVPVEPNAGACNPGPSGWVDQPPLVTDTYVWDFGASRTDAFASPFTIFPYEPVKDAQIALGDPAVYFWIRASNIPADSDWRVRWYAPGGALVWDGWVLPWGNTSFLRETWDGWYYDFPELHTTPGTWRMTLEINGEVELDVPIEFVAVIDPDFNRPPEPVTAAFASAPGSPGPQLIAEVIADLILDDLDWDIVRFRYEWTVNGFPVRDVTTAAHSDTLARTHFLPGNLVACRITPSDGQVGGTGTPVEITTVVPGGPWSDLGGGHPGSAGPPQLQGFGSLVADSTGLLRLTDARPGALLGLFVGSGVASVPFYGGTFVPLPVILEIYLNTGGGALDLPFVFPSGLPPGFDLVMQAFIDDPLASQGIAGSNAILGTSP